MWQSELRILHNSYVAANQQGTAGDGLLQHFHSMTIDYSEKFGYLILTGRRSKIETLITSLFRIGQTWAKYKENPLPNQIPMLYDTT